MRGQYIVNNRWLASPYILVALDMGGLQLEVLDLPDVAAAGGYIYVLNLENRVVKVGMTANPRERVACHMKQAEAFGARIVGAWLSGCHDGYARSERAMIDALRPLARRTIGRERFVGIRFHEVVEIAMNSIVGPEVDRLDGASE